MKTLISILSISLYVYLRYLFFFLVFATFFVMFNIKLSSAKNKFEEKDYMGMIIQSFYYMSFLLAILFFATFQFTSATISDFSIHFSALILINVVISFYELSYNIFKDSIDLFIKRLYVQGTFKMVLAITVIYLILRVTQRLSISLL